MTAIRTTRRRLGTGAMALAAALTLTVAGCGSTEETDPADGGDDPSPTQEETTVDEAPTTAPDDATSEPTEEPTTDEPTSPPGDGDVTSAPPAADAEYPAQGESIASEDAAQRPEVQAAIADAADRERVDAADIAVVSYEGVTWRDGSRGCPQPGQAYTMALVPGARLVLEVGGTEMVYHSGTPQPLEYCADPQEPAPGGGQTS